MIKYVYANNKHITSGGELGKEPARSTMNQNKIMYQNYGLGILFILRIRLDDNSSIFSDIERDECISTWKRHFLNTLSSSRFWNNIQSEWFDKPYRAGYCSRCVCVIIDVREKVITFLWSNVT